MGTDLTIGQFSTLTHLSIRTLRRYHQTGLLEPAIIDEHTGYRYYTPDQIPLAQVIFRLRQLDIPLADVQTIMSAKELGERTALIEAHVIRLQKALDRTQGSIAALRQLLDPGPDTLQVELRALPERTVVAVCGNVELDEVVAWYSEAMTELDSRVSVAERAGPPSGQYANELFTLGAGEVMVYYAVDPAADSSSATTILPPNELAVAVHAGGDADIMETYGRLGKWVAQHALAVAGPIHEAYLVAPRDTAVEADWRTEIGWPVFHVVADA